MDLTKKELNRIAKERGFVRDTLEKVCLQRRLKLQDHISIASSKSKTVL